MVLPKPYEKRFFSKIKYHPLFPNMDTDRDGVVDYKDCRPFDPTMQDEPTQPKNDFGKLFYLYIFENGNWTYQGEYIVDATTDTLLKELSNIYGKENIIVSDLYVKPERIGKKGLKKKFLDYFKEHQFKEQIKTGFKPDEQKLRQAQRNISRYGAGPTPLTKIMEKERDIIFKSEPATYHPLRWEECSVRAAWQTQKGGEK